METKKPVTVDSIIFIGIEDEQLSYKVEVNGHKFDYCTGLGWLEARTKGSKGLEIYPTSDMRLNAAIINAVAPTYWGNRWLEVGEKSFYDKLQKGMRVFRRPPDHRDILAALKSDADLGMQSFSDFCDNLGLSTDSFKAFDIYRSCEETARKLWGVTWPVGIEDY